MGHTMVVQAQPVDVHEEELIHQNVSTVELCRNAAVVDNTADAGDGATQTANLVNAMCIGRSDQDQNPTNSIAFDTFDIFDEATHISATATTWAFPAQPLDFPYQTSVLRLSKSDSNGITITQDLEISNIQVEQIKLL